MTSLQKTEERKVQYKKIASKIQGSQEYKNLVALIKENASQFNNVEWATLGIIKNIEWIEEEGEK